MPGDFKVGAVLDWDKFKFSRPGAEPKDKLLIVLGAKQGSDFLMALTTSRPHWRKFNHGCNAQDGYYFIPGTGKDFFSEDTWVLLNDVKIASSAEVVRGALQGGIRCAGNLRQELARAIINCLKKTDDVSGLHLSLLS
jgi:hypothetical protein